MNIQELRNKVIGKDTQVCVFDPEGKLVDSCNTLEPLKKGADILEIFPFLEGIQDQVFDLYGDKVFQLTGMQSLFGFKEYYLDILFYKEKSEGNEVVLAIVKDITVLYGTLRDINQAKSEAIIENEKVRIRQEELKVHIEKLQRLNTELDRFAYVVSHDLKAPLRGIRNLVSFISEDMEGKLEEGVEENMELLNKQVDKMAALIDAILLYSRAGRIKAPIKEVDTGKLIQEIVPTLGIPEGFTIDIQEDLPVILGHPVYLEQIFTNLIYNAYRHHPGPTGNIWVRGSVDEEGVRFSVKDDGKGIDPAYHERIFEIFQSLETRDPLVSTGIGLSIVKKLIKEMEGTIEVDSSPGNGANFIMKWPLQEPD